MALDDSTAPLPEEDFSDFTVPTNLLRAPSWVAATPEVRPQLVDRAMNAFLGELDQKRDKVIDSVNAKGEPIKAPVWSPAGTLTEKGQEFVNQTRQLLQTAAQDPEGGIYQDDMSGKWETSHWVGEFGKGPKQKPFDPLHDLEDWRKERSALDTDDNKAGGTWEQFVEHSNAGTQDEAAKIDPNNKELAKEWARRMAIADFDPRTMGDQVIAEVGGQYIVNPAKYNQIDEVEGAINSLPIPESEKKMMLLQQRDLVEKNAGEIVNAFAAADAFKQVNPLLSVATLGAANVFAPVVSRPLNEEFAEEMAKPNGSAYEFIKRNKERFNKDNYGVGQEIAETFRDAVMATGTGALWLGSAGNLTSPMEAWGSLAADSAKAYNNGKAFDVFGIDINRRDLTELTGQIGSFIAMGGAGALAGRGLAQAGASGASRYLVGAEGKLVSRAAQEASAKLAAIEAGTATPASLAQKAGNLAKTIATDSEVILGANQAAGMSYGKTFNDAFERTGSREEAHKEATIHGVADGLGAFIATSIMNRFAKGAGRLLDGGENTGGSLVQSIRSKVSGKAAMREVQESFNKLAGAESKELRKAFGASLLSEMDNTSKRLGLRGFGIGGDMAAEGIEETMDEVISGAIQSMSHDSKSWTEAEWEQIQNNWQGYVKAGILGAIGGTAGAAQNAALNPRQVFGKSDALQVQEGMWKAIKSNVEKFNSPGMMALDGRADGLKSTAEYLADPNTSIQDKADVLVATARGKSLANFAQAFTPAAPAAATNPVTGATESDSAASDSASGTEPSPTYSEGSLGSLMAEFGYSPAEGSAWNDVKLEDGPEITLGKLGSASVVTAPNTEGKPQAVAVRLKGQDGTVTTLSAEQAVTDLAASPEAEGILASLSQSGQDKLARQFSTKIETTDETGTTEQGTTGTPAGESGSAAAPAQVEGLASVEPGTSGGKPAEAGAAPVATTEQSSLVGSVDVSPTKNDISEKAENGRVAFKTNDGQVTANFEHTPGDTTAELDTFLNKEKGNGRGMKLLAHAEQSMAAKGVTKITAQADNRPGLIALYEKNGYTVTGKSKDGKTVNIEKSLSAPANETKSPEALIPAAEIKADVTSGDALSKDEQGTATAVNKGSVNKVSVSAKPKVSSIVSKGFTVSSHQAEMEGLKETGLWLARDGKVTVEPKLLRELIEKHDDDDTAIAEEIDARVTAMKNAQSGFNTLDAAAVSDKKHEGAAIDAIDPEGALIVASDTIEKGQTDEVGGQWERVDMREPAELEQAADNVNQDGLGEKIVYAYKAPKGHAVSVKVGQTVLISGEPNSILVLDSVSNGKLIFRKVDLKPEGIMLRTLDQGVKNIQWNRTRLVEQAKQAKPLLHSIANGTVSTKDLRALFDSVMDGVAPNFKNRIVEADLSKAGQSYLRTNFKTGKIEVDFNKLKAQLHLQYRGVNLTSDVANDALAADVTRIIAYWADEEVVHLLTKGTFETEELEDLYKDIASNPKHPFHKMLLETVAERYPGYTIDNKAADKSKRLNRVEGADFVVAAELIRKLHQMKHSGSYSERATYESQLLQASVNMDADEHGKIGKLVNTVAALVKRYSDRIKNILSMRWAVGQLPKHQQQMLFRLEQAYRQSGANGDVNFAQEDALNDRLSMQRDATKAHLKWGNKITGEHFQAVAQLREIADQFPNLKFENLFDVDAETLAMSLKPGIKDYLEKHVPEFAPDAKGGSVAMDGIEALLGDINDEKSDLSADQTGFERASDLVFINRQVMEARMAAMDFDITPALELGFAETPNTGEKGERADKFNKMMSRIAQHIENTVPKEQQPEHWIELRKMWSRRINAIQDEIGMIHKGIAETEQRAIAKMDARTNVGRRMILADAKRLGIENPFNREGINPNDVTGIMERLKGRLAERAANLAQHSASRVPTGDDSFSRLTTLGAELAAARRGVTDAEANYITAQDAAPGPSGESSARMTKFIEFTQALDTYNESIRNLHRLAFGDVWERPKEFGLNMRDLNRESRAGRGDRLSFPTSIRRPSTIKDRNAASIAPSTSKNDTFGVRFEDTGRFLGFRPKLHFFEEGKGKEPLTKEQVLDNQERSVLEIAGNSNAAHVGRSQWLQFFVDWVDGKITDPAGADTYWHTGGFALPKDTNSEIGADRYRAANAFRSADVKLFNDLVFKASDEAAKLAKGKGDKNTPARKALLEHIGQMEAWAKETLALVNPPEGEGFAPLITELGGKQTLAGRVKGLIESQFARKPFLRTFSENGQALAPGSNGEMEVDGLIAVLDELHTRIANGDHAAVASELFEGSIVDVRRRLDGANDAARLTNKALVEFRDQTWRDNVALEGSRVQRQASFTPDNPELLRLREAPIDARILSNLSWLMKFHEKSRDYAMGSNQAFELLEMINRSNRGEGVMPVIYDKAGNITDPSVFDDDKRTNRAETVQSMLEQRAGDSFLTGAEMAIDQEAQPFNQRRMALTAAALMIGSQTNGDTLDIDAGRTFLFDLWAMENNRKSPDEQRQLLRKGIRGTFPLAKKMANSEQFYDEMLKEVSDLLPSSNDLSGDFKRDAASMETVLVRLLELKQSFEASIVEEAKAGQNIGRALNAVKLSFGGETEVNEVTETEEEQTIPNPDFIDSPFTNEPKTIKQKVKVRKVKKVKKSALQSNSLASQEEAEAIARLIKGMMLTNSAVGKDGSVGEALNVYDASLLIHGIDGIGNPILSLLAQNLPGETLVVSPRDNQVTRFGLDDVGLKIFRGTDGGPNVIYAPQNQKNPEKNQTESFGGIAQSLMIASQNPVVRENVAEMARRIRLVLDPAVFPNDIAQGVENGASEDIASHVEHLAELGRRLNVDGDKGASINMFGDDQSNGSDILIIAEILTNPDAKRLFDEAYIGLDNFENTLLAEPVELALQDSIRNILKADTGAQEFDGDYVDNATEESVDEEQEVDDYDWENTREDSPFIQALNNVRTVEEQDEVLSGSTEKPRKGERKANRFGPDARRINGTLKADKTDNALNPSDAFLFNGLARILEHGKAAGGAFPLAPVSERATSDILRAPLDPTGQGLSSDPRRIAVAGPALKGNVSSGQKRATQIYVGEMRNLTIPKVEGRTAHSIAFAKRNIDSTNSSLLLRAPAVRALVKSAVVKQAISRLSDRADAGLGRVDVALPLDDAMMESIASALPAGKLDEALNEARLSLETLEQNENRLLKLREALMAEIGAYEADNGQAFQELLDNSPQGQELLAGLKDWSESLKAETRDMVVAHVTRFAEMLAGDAGNAANLGHVVHSMLSEGMQSNPQLKAAADGLYKQANELGSLLRERNTLLTPDENNDLPQGDVEGINSRISDAARLFNLHASIFNSQSEMHARQVMRWTGIDPKKANLQKFRLKQFKDTDNIGSGDVKAASLSLAGMLNGQKLAQGFLDNMVRDIAQGVSSGAKPKAQTNAFMQMVAKELVANPRLDLPAFIDEKLNEALDEEGSFGADFQQALQDIAMTTNEGRHILSSKARSEEQEEGRKQASIYLGKVERELDQTRKELGIIDTNKGSMPVGLGYYSDVVAQGTQKSPDGKVITQAIEKRPVTMGARLTLTNPAPMPASDAATASPSALSESDGTLSQRDFWTRQKAVISALTEQSENRIEDAYKFVRGGRDQFLNFDPLKAINQAVDLVELEEQIIKEVMQDARAEAKDAGYKGLTEDAAAYLSDPEEAMVLTRTAQNRVKQINLPKSHQLRKEKLGTLINHDGEKVIMLPQNARELLMERFPKITKRNVNREIEKIILDALPVNQGSPAQGSYSYFLNGTKAEEPKPFDGTGFSPTKTGLNKGQAAKAFSEDWKRGMQVWMDDAMSSLTGERKTAVLTGDLSQAQLNQFGYMIERLVIAHGDPRLSPNVQKKIAALLHSIDSGEFAKIGGSSSKMDVSRMLALRVEPVFSQAFAEIEAEEIQKRLVTDFVSFDGKKHALELGALKFLHHQDARIRSKFRRNYAARQAAIHLQDFIEYGIDGKSGRQGYETAKKAEEQKIVEAAKPLGNSAKNQTIGYLISVFQGIDSAFAMHKQTATNRLVADIANGLNQLENLNAAQGDFFGTLEKDDKGKLLRDAQGDLVRKKGLKAVIPTLNRYWNADNLDMTRDLELSREVRGWLKESGIANALINSPEEAEEEIEKFVTLLKSKVEGDKLKEVEAYAAQLNDSFADISSAMQLTMAMLSRDAAVDKGSDEQLLKGERLKTGEAWQDDAKEAFKPTYSSVPLRIGFAARPDPKDRQSSSDRFVTDPIDIVSLKDSSFFGGFGKSGFYNSKDPFRPISVNGLTAPLSLLDDAIYKLNVTPTYEVLRRSFGRVQQDEHGVNSIKDGDFLTKANSLVPDNIDWSDRKQRDAKHAAEEDVKRLRQALSVIAGENETVLQNDAANGVVNTGGAELMRFLGSVFIVRALASVQQRWNQTAAPSMGYAVGKIAAGKAKHAAQYFDILQQLIRSSYTKNGFYEQARQFIHDTDRSIYYRASDGADVARDIMHRQERFGANKLKNKAGKAIRKYEEIGEKALHWSIGTGESYLATAMYIVELADQMGMNPKDVIKGDVELTAMAKSNARRKVNDVMGMSDQSKKAAIFQNKTSSPGRNALWRSMVRFSNQTSSIASNTSVMVPVLFDKEADPETKKEALENVVTSLTQNILFNPFKAQVLIPLLAYMLYGLGGDDDDKAQRRSQELANKLMAVDKDSNPLASIIKTLTFGRKKELFQQDKGADAAQASAFAEIGAKSLNELATTIPVFGVLAGFSPVSGLMQKKVTNPLAIAAATNANNMFNPKKLKQSGSPHDKKAVTIRDWDGDWDENLASLTAPSQMAYDALSAASLLTRYNMSRHAEKDRVSSLLDSAVYLTAELVPFAREMRSQTRGELKDELKKEKKR